VCTVYHTELIKHHSVVGPKRLQVLRRKQVISDLGDYTVITQSIFGGGFMRVLCVSVGLFLLLLLRLPGTI